MASWTCQILGSALTGRPNDVLVARYFRPDRDGNATLRFRFCPPGVFLMGSPRNEKGRWEIEAQHEVEHSRPFWMSESPISQEVWEFIGSTTLAEQARFALLDTECRRIESQMRTQSEFYGLTPDHAAWLADGPNNRPMHFVSWHEANQFCSRLSTIGWESEVLPRECVIRLPTEAEWEYACRAGTVAATYGGDPTLSLDRGSFVLDPICWHEGNWNGDFGRQSHLVSNRQQIGPPPTRCKRPNSWGLFDMIGNVWEWCLDTEAEYPTSRAVDPIVKGAGRRIPRGGSWYRLSRACRAANRGADDPGFRSNFTGFRVVISSISHCDV